MMPSVAGHGHPCSGVELVLMSKVSGGLDTTKPIVCNMDKQSDQRPLSLFTHCQADKQMKSVVLIYPPFVHKFVFESGHSRDNRLMGLKGETNGH